MLINILINVLIRGSHRPPEGEGHPEGLAGHHGVRVRAEHLGASRAVCARRLEPAPVLRVLETRTEKHPAARQLRARAVRARERLDLQLEHT